MRLARACERPPKAVASQHARGTRRPEGAARLGRCEVRLPCGRVGLKGAAAIPASGASGKTRDEVSWKDEDARRKDRKERVKRATEDRGERIESSRLGLWECSPPIRSRIRNRLPLTRRTADQRPLPVGGRYLVPSAAAPRVGGASPPRRRTRWGRRWSGGGRPYRSAPRRRAPGRGR